MSTAVMVERIAQASPRRKARIAGVFYLLSVLTGGVVLLVRGRLGFANVLIATSSYIVVTLLFYYISKPWQREHSTMDVQTGAAAASIHARKPWSTEIVGSTPGQH